MGRKQDEMRVRLGMLGTLEQHIRLNPHDTRALYIGAQNLWHVGEQKKSAELAEQALGQGQDEPMVLYNVACLYTTQGNPQRALELLRSEEHTSELPSPMRISYAGFCLKKKRTHT